MNAHVKTVSGIADSMISLFISKRNWSEEKDETIRNLCDCVLTPRGYLRSDAAPADIEEYEGLMAKLAHWGLKMEHTTLLRFIDFSVLTQDLHRGAQDDLDAHGWRMENRIIRSSTRLASFSTHEKSEFYEDKILHPAEVCDLPDQIEKDGLIYLRAGFGYVRADLVNEQDVVRGTYPLAIPSTCIWKASLPALRHIYRLRGPHGAAHPELKQMMERLLNDLNRKNPPLAQLIQ